MNKQRIRFSGHQTFSLRYGWLEKGYEFTARGKRFSHESSIVDLGVGKNMVDSIKYWCEMTGIIEEDRVSRFGQQLLDEQKGWDPYLEDLASWWLLHWKIITHVNYKTSGTALFSYLRKPEFSKQDVAEATLRLVDEGKKAPPDSIIMRDVDCFIRSYCGTRRFEKKKAGEDTFECPFQELNLIQVMSDGDFYRFSIGSKVSLPAEIIGYAICEYFGREKKNAMTIQKILYREGSPGQVFMLDENTLIEAVQDLHENPIWGRRFDFTESAGLAQVYCNVDPEESEELLNIYYRQGGASWAQN
ncbi:MAG: DUF4007 family protein [Chlorobiaceae bacterium]